MTTRLILFVPQQKAHGAKISLEYREPDGDWQRSKEQPEHILPGQASAEKYIHAAGRLIIEEIQ